MGYLALKTYLKVQKGSKMTQKNRLVIVTLLTRLRQIPDTTLVMKSYVFDSPLHVNPYKIHEVIGATQKGSNSPGPGCKCPFLSRTLIFPHPQIPHTLPLENCIIEKMRKLCFWLQSISSSLLICNTYGPNSLYISGSQLVLHGSFGSN